MGNEQSNEVNNKLNRDAIKTQKEKTKMQISEIQSLFKQLS